MNAESERGSLPDRVEAADPRAVKLAELIGEGMDAWDADDGNIDLTTAEYVALYVLEHEPRALAAADACEAERNPNTTDDALEQVGWMSAGVWSPMGPDSLHDKYPNLNGYEVIWRPVYARRRVSSEDVHREAAE